MHGSTVHFPGTIGKIDAVTATLPSQFTAKKSTVGIETPVRLKLRILIVSPFAHSRATTHEQIRIGKIRPGSLQNVQQRAGENATVVFAFPGFLNSLTGGQKDVLAGRNFKPLAAFLQSGVIAIDIAVQRSFFKDFMSLPTLALTEIIGTACGRAGMATVQDHSDVRLALCQLGKEHGQLLVSQIKSAGFTAVVTDKSFVHPIGIELLKRLCRFPPSAMAAILENDNIVRFGLAKVRAELLDHVGPRGVCIFENFDPQP